jgi:hypothetical protein
MVTQCENQQYLKLTKIHQPILFDKGASMKIPVPAVKSTKGKSATGSPARPPWNWEIHAAATQVMLPEMDVTAADMNSRVNNVFFLQSMNIPN